jgi:hypothetical protein
VRQRLGQQSAEDDQVAGGDVGPARRIIDVYLGGLAPSAPPLRS